MSNKLDILAAAQKQKNKGNVRSSVQQKPLTSNNIDAIDEAFFKGSGDNVDSFIYGGGMQKIYNPQEELESLQNKNYLRNIGNSKLPKAILESFINNPIEVSYEGLMGNNEILTEEVKTRSLDIISKLEDRDKKKNGVVTNSFVNEEIIAKPTDVGVNIDIEQLSKLIENVIDNKLKMYLPNMINESKNSNTNNLSLMKLGENFTFIDDDNNVYECKMVYKGKAKMKKK